MIQAVKDYQAYFMSIDSDLEHDPKLTKLSMMAHEQYRNDLVDPIECSYTQFVKGKVEATALSFYITAALIALLCLIPLILIIVGLVSLCAN